VFVGNDWKTVIIITIAKIKKVLYIKINRDGGASGASMRAGADHRFANHLAILAGLIRTTADQVGEETRPISGRETALMLKEFEGRLLAASRLDRMLAAGPENDPVDALQYVRSVVASTLCWLSAEEAFEVRYQRLVPCFLPVKKASALALLIGELVANAVKYAHPTGVDGQINVKVSPLNGAAIQFEVADDGVGFPEGFDPVNDAGFGLRMVRTLSAQLGAKLSFESFGLGLSCIVQFPYRMQ
jgi:two-component sensor histidine kinase